MSHYAFQEIGSRVMQFRISIILDLALDDLFDANEVEKDHNPLTDMRHICPIAIS